jgi:flagellar motor switch protein FliM
MMGGSGITRTPIRKITDFEKALVTELFNHFIQYYSDTVRKFVDIEPKIELVETDKYLIPRNLSDEEVLVRLLFEIDIDGVSGLLQLSVPYNFISPFFSKFLFVKDSSSTIKEELSKFMVKGSFSKIGIPISMELHPRKVSLDELVRLKEGDILPLDFPFEGEFELRVDNNLKFFCKPGVHGGRLAARITRSAGSEG